jgi:hypothetical protein
MPLTLHQQLSAYAAYLKDLGHLARWTAFLDIDEFLTPRTVGDIREYLRDYEDYGGLCAHWKVFGSNGHLRTPEANVIDAFPHALYPSPHVKSIVQARRVAGVASPHHFAYRPGHFAVNERREPVPGPKARHTSETIQINHYYYCSQQDFERKKRRGMATLVRNRDGYAMDEFHRQALRPQVEDTAIRRFAEAVRTVEAHGPDAVPAMRRAARSARDADHVVRAVAEAVVREGSAAALALLQRLGRGQDDPVLRLAEAGLLCDLGREAEALARLDHVLAESGGDLAFRAAAKSQLERVRRSMAETASGRRRVNSAQGA